MDGIYITRLCVFEEASRAPNTIRSINHSLVEYLPISWQWLIDNLSVILSERRDISAK